MGYKPDGFTTATEATCLLDALRVQLQGPASARPDIESVSAARARFGRLNYGERLTLIGEASREVCLALYADLTARESQPSTRTV
jgi:hypothetical protein